MAKNVNFYIGEEMSLEVKSRKSLISHKTTKSTFLSLLNGNAHLLQFLLLEVYFHSYISSVEQCFHNHVFGKIATNLPLQRI